MFKKCYSLIFFIVLYVSSVNAEMYPDPYTLNLNLRAVVPELIDKVIVYDKKDELYKINNNIVISKNGKLSFTNKSKVQINGVNITNENINDPDGILFEGSNLIGNKANILSTLTLKNSILLFSEGKINKLIVTGTADVSVKGTIFDTIEFNKLGATDGSKTAVAFDKIKAKNINIDITGFDNKLNRQVNIKDAEVDNIKFKGYITVISNGVEDTKLNTTFNFTGGKVKLVDYTDSALKEMIKLPQLGFLNFKETTIEDMKVSYNLLRGVTFNGVTINNLKIENTNLAPSNNDESTRNSNNGKVTLNETNNPPEMNNSDVDPNIPKPPTFANLRFMGLGTSFIKNLDLNNAKTLNIEGEISPNQKNGTLSSVYILNMKNYKDTNISLYNLKYVYFGTERPKKDKPENKPEDKPKKDEPEKNKIPGGKNDTINISHLHRVTTLGIHDNTIKFNWNVENNKTYNYPQYLSIYNLSQLNLVNSLVDISKTADLKINIKSDSGNKDTDPDPRKFNTIYDYNITYEGSMSAFGTIFNFENSGAIKNNNRNEYIPLRIKVVGNSFVTAKDMRSDLHMQLNGERNIFVLESNKHNKSYTFHTNFNFAYIKAKNGKTKPGGKTLQYNYWDYNEATRVEQNIYTLKSDILIVDPNSAEYKKYKEDHAGELPKGEKDFATIWFTYWQPYKVDKNGNPKLKDNKDKPENDKDWEYGDELAWEQKTDGTGRGGFPVEFGNRITVEEAKVTFLKPLDNLTVLEILGNGNANFHDMDIKHVSKKGSQWITNLRMRGGILTLAKVPMCVDKLVVYNYGMVNEATFRPIYEVKNGSDVNTILNQQKLLVNKEADFKNNFLKVDLYFNDYFLNLNQKVTLNVLELGEYKQKVKVKEGDKEVEKEIIKQAVIKSLKGVNFEQGLLFSTNYYWKDKNLFVEITRTKNFNDFIKNCDSTISNIFDTIINKYSVKIDKNNKIQLLDKNQHPSLSKDTIKIINELFKAKDAHDLKSSFMSLRPLNNELVFNITNINTTRLLDSIKNSNNYSAEANKGRLISWSNYNTSNNTIHNNKEAMGSNVSSNTFSVGAHTKVYNVKLGAFVGYVNSNYNSAYSDGKSSLYGGGVYSDLSIKNGYFVKLASLYSITNFDGKRHQYFMNDKTKFNFNGKSLDFYILTGKSYVIKNGIITSFIGLNSGYLSFDKYKEEGGSGTLDVEGFSSPYATGSVGVEYAKEIPLLSYGSLIPKIGVTYSYKYYNIKDVEASFNKINGINPILNNIKYSSNNYGKNSVIINAGINYILSTKSTFSSNFNANIINSDVRGYAIYLGYKYSF